MVVLSGRQSWRIAIQNCGEGNEKLLHYIWQFIDNKEYQFVERFSSSGVNAVNQF